MEEGEMQILDMSLNRRQDELNDREEVDDMDVDKVIPDSEDERIEEARAVLKRARVKQAIPVIDLTGEESDSDSVIVEKPEKKEKKKERIIPSEERVIPSEKALGKRKAVVQFPPSPSKSPKRTLTSSQKEAQRPRKERSDGKIKKGPATSGAADSEFGEYSNYLYNKDGIYSKPIEPPSVLDANFDEWKTKGEVERVDFKTDSNGCSVELEELEFQIKRNDKTIRVRIGDWVSLVGTKDEGVKKRVKEEVVKEVWCGKIVDIFVPGKEIVVKRNGKDKTIYERKEINLKDSENYDLNNLMVHIAWVTSLSSVPSNLPPLFGYEGLCDDVRIDTILSVIDVNPVVPSPTRPSIEVVNCDEESCSYSAFSVEKDLSRCGRVGKPDCASCEAQIVENKWEIPTTCPGGFRLRGVAYAVGDAALVYLGHDEDGIPWATWEIYFLLSFDLITGQGNFGRLPRNISYSETSEDNAKKTGVEMGVGRELVLTDDITKFSLEHLRGKAVVIHIDDLLYYSKIDQLRYVTTPNQFYIRSRLQTTKNFAKSSTTSVEIRFDESDLLPISKATLQEVVKFDHVAQSKRESKLAEDWNVLDMFCGGGGAMEGAKASGLFKESNITAIDSNKEACKVARANFPLATVVESDVIAFSDPNKKFKVAWISPPCQSLSKANIAKNIRNLKKNPYDERDLLPFRSVKRAAEMGMEYGILENVAGMSSVGITRDPVTGKPVKGKFLEILLRFIISLGYDVQCQTLQAGEYGVPQARKRVIILMTKKGLTMATIPIASTSFGKTGMSVRFGSDKSKGNRNDGRNQPASHINNYDFETVTTDLGYFQARNPRRLVRDQLSPDRLEGVKVAQYTCTNEEDQAKVERAGSYYPVAPRNPLQRLARVGPNAENITAYINNEDGNFKQGICRVSSHISSRLSALVAERVSHIDTSGDANFSNLPAILQMPQLGETDLSEGSYSRMHYNAPFSTVTCTPLVSGGGCGSVIHPVLNRIVSVREVARAQGLPDHFNLNPDGTVKIKEQYKIVGNMVPPPLAAAIYHSIAAAIYQSRELNQC